MHGRKMRIQPGNAQETNRLLGGTSGHPNVPALLERFRQYALHDPGVNQIMHMQARNHWTDMEMLVWLVFNVLAEKEELRDELLEVRQLRGVHFLSPVMKFLYQWRPVSEIPAVDPETCRSADLLGCWSNGSMMVISYDCTDPEYPWQDAEDHQGLAIVPELINGQHETTYLTHWMPLPEGPK